jgi:hypothetical protein
MFVVAIKMGAQHSELESALFQWFSQKRALEITINGPLIKGKASEVALRLKIEKYAFGYGWHNRF